MQGLCKLRLILLLVLSGFFLFHLQARGEQADAVADKPASSQSMLLTEISIEAAQQAMADDRLTAVSLASYYLQQIETRNDQLNAVININPDLLAQARTLDQERAAGNVRSPLHGIPVLLKDNIEAREKMPTTAGSLALQNNYTGRDAAIVRKLRASGALILGKANLSEWANFRSTR